MYKFIYHISDIHIRLYSRMKEYETVFDELYRYLQKDILISEECLIVITGDILHNKVDLTPECILMTLRFLHTLSSIATVILIAGNHDALLNNRDRVDSITSILQDRCPSQLHYLKTTGYYEFGNIVFGVRSILDDIELGPLIEKKKGYIYIGLFHGQMNGWINSFGYRHDHGETQVDNWKDFDLVLLGDIHQFQYMNTQKTIAYAGSLISQNFGETNLEHGILKWNLQDFSSQYHILSNPYAYKLMEFLPNNHFKMDKQLYPFEIESLRSVLPFFCNLKIKLPFDVSFKINDKIQYLKEQFPNIKIQIETPTKINISNSISDSISESYSLTKEGEWIEMYFKEKLRSTLSISQVDKMIKDVMTQYKLYVHENKSHHPSWELVSLSFSNLFGYGSNDDMKNEIIMNKLHPHTVTGIFGHNSAGKSSLIDIIVFLLYGKITRGSIGNSTPKEIIHFEEKQSEGEIQFKVGHQLYKMVKKMSRKQDKIKIVETLYINEKGVWKNISEEHRKKTDKLIEQLLGTMDSFLFTNFTLQQYSKSFRDMTQKEKKEFLYQLLSLHWFEDYKKKAEEQFKTLKVQESTYNDMIHSISVKKLQEEQNRLQLISQTVSNEMDQLSDSIIQMETEYNSYLRQSIDPSQLTTIELEWNELKKTIKNIQKQLKEVEQTKKRLLDNDKLLSISELELKLNHYQLIESFEKEIKTMIILPFSDIKLTKSFPSIEDWLDKNTFIEWKSKYSYIKQIIQKSETIMKEWNQLRSQKEQLQIQINNIPISSLSYFTSDADFIQFESKQKKYQGEINQLKEKIKEISFKEISSSFEELYQKLAHTYQQYQTIQCEWKIYQESFKDALNVSYNIECKDCMKNPFYVKKKEHLEKIKHLEKNELQLRQYLLTQLNKITYLSDSQKETMSIEQRIQLLNSYIQEQKQQKLHFLTTKDILHKKEKLYQEKTEKYKNTLLYHQYLELKRQLLHIQTEMENGEIANQYKELTHCLKYMNLYEKLNQYWELRKELSLNWCDEIDKLRLQINQLQNSQELLDQYDNEWEELHQQEIKSQIRLQEMERLLDKYRCNLVQEQKMNEFQQRVKNLRTEKNKKQTCLYELEKDKCEITLKMKQQEDIVTKIEVIKEQKKYWETLISCIDRDGLPLFLLQKYLPTMEEELNLLCQTFLTCEKQVRFRLIEKDIIIGIESNQQITNYLGGMESFILDLSLKFIFSKYAQIPRSNFFIIDEGVSVFDQEKMSHIQQLFNFLSSIVEHVFLISHLPTIQDHVDQHISIQKVNKYSQLICNY